MSQPKKPPPNDKDDGLAEPPTPLASPTEAEEFWTEERLRGAKPVPMPNPIQQPAFRAQTTSDLPQYAPPQVQPYDQVSSVTEQTTRKLENPN